jgi:hypothetical protein
MVFGVCLSDKGILGHELVELGFFLEIRMRVDCSVCGGRREMKLIGRDANYWSTSCMPFFDLLRMETTEVPIVIKPVPVGNGGHGRSRE